MRNLRVGLNCFPWSCFLIVLVLFPLGAVILRDDEVHCRRGWCTLSTGMVYIVDGDGGCNTVWWMGSAWLGLRGSGWGLLGVERVMGCHVKGVLKCLSGKSGLGCCRRIKGVFISCRNEHFYLVTGVKGTRELCVGNGQVCWTLVWLVLSLCGKISVVRIVF